MNNQLVGSDQPFNWYSERPREDYVCVHPFTRKLQGQWGLWQRLIYDLTQHSPVRLIGQGQHDYSMCDRDFTNRTSLREVFKEIARARMVVTADTGIMHLAVATNTPCVALFARTMPSLRIPKNGCVTPCYIPCEYAEYFHRAGKKSKSNLSEIQYEEVIGKCHSILTEHQQSWD